MKKHQREANPNQQLTQNLSRIQPTSVMLSPDLIRVKKMGNRRILLKRILVWI